MSDKSPLLDPENAEMTVCFCNCVPIKDIVAAIEAGAHTLEAIQEKTLASTSCGGCEYDVRDILEGKLAEIKAAQAAQGGNSGEGSGGAAASG